MSGFVSIPFEFAGTKSMVLSMYEDHLLKRFEERFCHSFHNGKECLAYLAARLQDKRLGQIVEKVPKYGNVVLYLESENMYVITRMGTKVNANEICVSTVLPHSSERTRLMIQEDDFPYVLPIDGKLRFGKERKYFELKKQKSKYQKK